MHRRMFVAVLFLASTFAASLPTAKPEDVGLSGERLQRIHAMIQGYIDRQEIAGAVTLVARRGRVAWLHAQGMQDLESKKPMREDAIFRIASMTKPIASVAVMMLFEEGRLQLTDPVSKYIPEFKEMMIAVPSESGPYTTVRAKQPIRIRHLLTHTAGLANPWRGVTKPDYDKLVAGRGPEETVGEFVKKLAKLPLNFEPGEKWEYGPAHDVLGYLVEVISGMPLDQFLAQRLLNPLGMKDIFFHQPAANESRRVTVYTPAEPRGIRPRDMGRPSARFFGGGGGLSSTIDDYVRFSQMMLNGGQLDGTRVLSRKTVELMTMDHTANVKVPPRQPGDGWTRRQRTQRRR